MREILKGNEAVALGALAAGLTAFFGYPITPSSEIPETLAKYYPEKLKIYLQAESEIGAVNMMLGVAACGARVMTATSSPGFSLMTEGISYMAGSMIPGVFVNITRGGPGLGNIGGETSDYFQMVKAPGHGNLHLPVFAPNSAQEMYSLTIKAFNVADKYRIPVIVTAEGFLGQMKEVVDVYEPKLEDQDKSDWIVIGTKYHRKHIRHIVTSRKPHIITSIRLKHDTLEEHQHELLEIYEKIEENEVDFEEYRTEDAKIIFFAYGITSRITKGVVDTARDKGMRVGLLRPITLWPFPVERIEELANKVKAMFVVELAPGGQILEDIERAVSGKVPTYWYGRSGGNLPTEREILEQLETCYERI